jgi:uncharacterized lipoprotein YmbA
MKIAYLIYALLLTGCVSQDNKTFLQAQKHFTYVPDSQAGEWSRFDSIDKESSG